MMMANPQHFRCAVEDIPEWANETNRTNKTTESLGQNIEGLEPVFGSHGWLKLAQNGMIIGRGRNRGRTIAEIEQVDEDYLNWLGSSSGPLESEAISALQAERYD